MKDMRRFFMGVLSIVAMAVVTACSGMDELPQENVEPKAEIGYLQFSNFKVLTDTEDKDSSDEIETGGSTESKMGTRTDADADENTTTPDFSNYYIEIINSKGRVVSSGTYGNNYVDENGDPKPVGLEPGKYTVWAYQDQNKAPANGVAEDAPYYAGSASDVEIISERNTNVTVTCDLYNIKATVELSADLQDMFKKYEDSNSADYDKRLKTTVKIGVGETDETYNAHTFEKDATHNEGPFMYYTDVAGGPNNTMKILLEGVFYSGPVEDVYTGAAFNNPDNASYWKEVKMEKTVNSVAKGQWRKISIDIEHNDEGNAQFIFTIHNYVYDKAITVSTMQLYQNLTFTQEEEIPEDDINDERAPQVSIDGVTQSEDGKFRYNITADMYDTNLNKWSENLQATITIPEGSSTTVASLYAEFKQAPAALLTALESAGFTNGIVPLFPQNNVSTYVNVATGGSKISLLDRGMDAIYAYEGTHVIRLHTRGADGRVGFADVEVTVSQAASAGPNVQWKVNGTPSTSVEITKSDYVREIIASIKSSTGITGLKVVIDSEDLNEKTLGDLDLATEMDIMNPATPEMKARLEALKFLPLGDDLCNINFNISGFMSALVGFAGDHTFKVIVTDASGTKSASLTITAK